MSLPLANDRSHQTRSHDRGCASHTGITMYRLPKRRLSDWILLLALMAMAAATYFVNLTASGYANEFYSAAAQAGSVNWESFLWGSLDSGNAITVDKPPASIWLMALSVRAFGLSSFSILLPQAIMGVLTTYLLYATVRRYWGNAAGLITGIAFVLTPVAALMFRFNNPDALLVLLMVAAAHCVLRSLEYAKTRAGNRRRTWWMVLAGILVGFGFLTKQMQVFLVLPGFAIAFLIASPTGFLRRVVDGVAAVIGMVLAAGWWVALTVLVPSGSRPYIGGSQTDSFLELTFSY
ncbi:MAG: glycosyltransferase family 39 protein, partial [Bifidobacterium crudilactis]|nr:glycosyltransferase family 39 protein [Bifidobacterium crudilactis]